MTLRKSEKYLKLKEAALDRTIWRTCFGRGYGLVLRRDDGGGGGDNDVRVISNIK
jgi:hypothetical protein